MIFRDTSSYFIHNIMKSSHNMSFFNFQSTNYRCLARPKITTPHMFGKPRSKILPLTCAYIQGA
jgi:hypothetical protein